MPDPIVTWLKTLLFVCLLLLVFVFAALAVNQQQVALSFVRWQTPFTLSIFWWLLMSLLLGIFLGWSYSWVRPFPLRLKCGFFLFSGDLRSMTRRSSSTVTSSPLRSSFFRIEFLFEKIILSDPDDIRSCGL